MPFTTIKLNSVEEFLQVAVAPIENVVIYRGVPDKNYDLIPSIGRWSGPTVSRVHYERQAFEDFKSRAIGYLTTQPRNEWEWLFFGPTPWPPHPIAGLDLKPANSASLRT